MAPNLALLSAAYLAGEPVMSMLGEDRVQVHHGPAERPRSSDSL
jgi:hypothetical protein